MPVVSPWLVDDDDDDPPVLPDPAVVPELLPAVVLPSVASTM